MIFSDKQYLYLLLAVIILIFLFRLFYAKRKKALEKFANISALSVLTNADISSWIKKYIFLALGFIFLVLALARPQWGDKEEQIDRESAEIIVALDISKSMLAQDISPNRLERAKFMLLNIIEVNAGNRMGVIVFSGTAMWQCPMTYDLEALKMFMQDINVEQLPVGGTQISDAIILAANAAEKTPSSSKILLLISDGEDHDSKINEALNKAKDSGLKIISVGIGSKEGSPILDPATNRYITDNNGDTVVSKLNPTVLRKIAEQSGGQYFETEGRDISGALISTLESVDKNKGAGFESAAKVDRFQIFLFLALLAFLLAQITPRIKRKEA